MGHAIAIHKEIYRQPVVSRDILRMSQVLEKAQGINSDKSDETDTNYENGEISVENDINLSYKIEAESYSTLNDSNKSIQESSKLIKNINRSVKKRNST